MDYISDQLTSKLIEVVKKKEKKSGMVIKPFQVGLKWIYFINWTYVIGESSLYKRQIDGIVQQA